MSAVDAGIGANLQTLEAALLHTDFSNQTALLERLLAPDFKEINGQGETSRDQVLTWLLQKDPQARWDLSGFEEKTLASNVRLLTYHAQQRVPERPDSKGSLHASVWCFAEDIACWQLRFHQASKCI